MQFKYVLSTSEIFITFEMQLVRLPGVYSIFLYCCGGNKWERGNRKDKSLSGLAQTGLLRAAMVCTVLETVVQRADHNINISEEISKLQDMSNIIQFHGLGTSVLFMRCDFWRSISIIEIKRLVKAQYALGKPHTVSVSLTHPQEVQHFQPGNQSTQVI